jgi:hypothetical protein
MALLFRYVVFRFVSLLVLFDCAYSNFELSLPQCGYLLDHILSLLTVRGNAVRGKSIFDCSLLPFNHS